MQASKLLFSEDELRRAENSEWILTKNSIIKKIMVLFGSLSDFYQQSIVKYRDHLPHEIFNYSPKISKGEQYNGLPYVMLDYPRVFSKDDVLAIRTFFWWGNYFSLTLHLKGRYADQFREAIIRHFDLLSANYFFISHSEDEWIHEIDDRNYTELNGEAMRLIKTNNGERKFLKLACKWPMKNANEILELLEAQYSNLLKTITN